jgi:restriction endonuclease S subunit
MPNLAADALVSFLPMQDVGIGLFLEPSDARALEDVYDGYTYMRNGDVAIATISPSFQNGKGGVVRGAVNGICFATTELTPLRPRSGSDSRYLRYALQSESFLQEGTASLYGVAGQKRVPTQLLQDFKIWLPPISQQRQIADFLDRETQRIDDALALLGGLEGLLAEQFSVKIEDMLTPKPGSQRMRIDWVCDVLREQVSLEEIHQFDEVVLYSVDGVAATGSPVKTRGSEIESAKLRVHGGEILVSRLNPRRGHVTTTSIHDQVSLCSGEWVVLRPRSGFALEYLYFLFASDSTRQRLDSLVRSVTKSHGRVDPSEVTKMWATIPSAEVQIEISETLNRADRQRTEVSNLLEKQRELLAERRTALISAAVTGQFAVEAVA